MTSVINKRQQARNERALQELIRSVPGNDRCADCQARNPGWASWNLGIFLCMRCGSLHRKMGTHISKVKSLSMDSWTTDQVENMRRRGNDAVNKEYNPKGIKPAIPIDADEVDSAMERFIRQKYEHRILEDGKPKPPSRDDSGYHTQRSFDEPVQHTSPPIPPKSGRKFGFGLRSVSSTSRLPQLSTDRAATPSSPSSAGYGPSSPSVGINKQSRVFGLNLGEANVASVEMKLKMLRDMGFPNDRRNASVLKGHFGDMERAVESLTRLGEGGQDAPSQPSAGASPSNPDPAPPPISKSAADDPWSINTTVSSSAGAQVKPSAPAPAPAPTKSYNPFDAPQPTPQQAPTTGLENSFQSLQVSQRLFPHTTGGYPSQQMTAPTAIPPLQTSHSYTNSPQPVNHNPFFLSAPVSAQSTGNPYFNQSAQSTPIQPTQSLSPGNPFFGSISAQSTGAQQNQAPSSQGFPPPRHANTMPMYSSSQTFAPQQQQPQQPQYLQSSQTSYNPFNTSNTSSFNIQQQQQILTSHNPYQNQQMATPTARMDKNSIMSLYNLGPSGPTTMSTIPEQSQPQQPPPQQQQTNNPYQTTSPAPSLLTTSGSTPQTMQSQSPYNISTPQRSATMPEFVSPRPSDPLNNNPFFNTAQPQQQQSTNPFPTAAPVAAPAQSAGLGIGLGQTAAAPPPPPTKMNFMPTSHMSKGSVDINGLQNGRHSPDAFASLSARYA
ncbi:UBA domain-containing protein 3 [Talaromyces islandicus]|uniref:UBA domain-containing protein 3 n=1 Tax=Talaromyces islandicus TaxID=28573 RepID=A0A0U1M595_TALIS|nr:UBA domain-containing protein 3 [Talaromyces islandicus]